MIKNIHILLGAYNRTVQFLTCVFIVVAVSVLHIWKAPNVSYEQSKKYKMDLLLIHSLLFMTSRLSFCSVTFSASWPPAKRELTVCEVQQAHHRHHHHSLHLQSQRRKRSVVTVVTSQPPGPNPSTVPESPQRSLKGSSSVWLTSPSEPLVCLPCLWALRRRAGVFPDSEVGFQAAEPVRLVCRLPRGFSRHV